MSHQIRRAQPADANRLAVLAAQVFLHTYAIDGISPAIAQYVLEEMTPAKFTALLQNPAVFTSVAESGDNLLAFAVIHLDSVCPNATDATVELQTLYIQDHFVGKGIGHNVLVKMQELARLGADSRLWLTVNAKNARAIAFYQRQGYQELGTTEFVLGGVAHENHVMVGPFQS